MAEDLDPLSDLPENDGGGEDRTDVQGDSLASVYHKQAEIPPESRPLPARPPAQEETGPSDPSQDRRPVRSTDVISGSGVVRRNYLYGNDNKVQASYEQRLRGAPQAGDAQAPYVADPETQALVKKLEGSMTAIQNDQTLTPQPGQPDRRKPLLDNLQKQVDELDPHKWFRKGGILSQQTAVQKAMAERMHVNEQTGLVTALGPDGKFQFHNLPDRESKQHQIALKELEIQKVREERAARLESVQHDRNVKHEEKYGAVFDKMFPPHKLDENGIKTEMSPEEKMDLLKQRGAFIKKKRSEDLGEEADKAESLYSPKGLGVGETLYRQAYLNANSNLAPAHTLAELKRRHAAALDFLKQWKSVREQPSPAHERMQPGTEPQIKAPLPAHAVGLGSQAKALTGIADPKKALQGNKVVTQPKVDRSQNYFGQIDPYGGF